MDIFQQLMEYETQKDDKHLWEGEKAVLIWGGSDQHQHLGTPINSDHVKNALVYCVEKSFISVQDKDRLLDSASYILQNLLTHGFGKAKNIPEYQVDLIINRNGILAGQILIETDNLKNSNKYDNWSRDWWFLYYCAGLLIAMQAINTLVRLIEQLIKLMTGT